MIHRWRCNNTVSSVNENPVRTSQIFDNVTARLIGVSRSVVPSPGLLRESDPASLKEPSRPQVLPFGTGRVQECQETNLESEGRVCQASTTHCHYLVCRLAAVRQCAFHDADGL